MYSFGAWQLSDLAVSGPNPFGSNSSAESDAVGVTTFTISSAATLKTVALTDGDSNFTDGDSDQELSGSQKFNGTTWSHGEEIETEYSYIIRPVGSSNPADNIRIYVLEYNGDVQGIASSARLFAGQSYKIVAIDSNSPSVPYSSLAVCFAAGTLITTARGLVPVEALRVGMRVQTVDNGMQRLHWIGRQRVHGLGADAPIEIGAGVLGNTRALTVSAQHRMLLRPDGGPLAQQEILAPAKGLLGREGVRRAPVPSVLWHHFMFARHEIVLAEGAEAESFLPGPEAMKSLGLQAGQGLARMLKGLPDAEIPARAIVPPGRMDRLRARWGARAIGLGGRV